MSIEEIKDLLKSREPVEAWDLRMHMWIEYLYIRGVMTRYNTDTGRFYIRVELMDKNERCVVMSRPEYIRKAENPN